MILQPACLTVRIDKVHCRGRPGTRPDLRDSQPDDDTGAWSPTKAVVNRSSKVLTAAQNILGQDAEQFFFQIRIKFVVHGEDVIGNQPGRCRAVNRRG